MTALLPRVLRRGSANHPDMELIAAALDDLYGARIEPIVRKKGEMQCIGFYADFPDDRYIPDSGGVFEKTARLLGEILLAPDKRGNLLREDYIESEKSNLIDDIRAAINDKRGYSVDRLLEEMCADEAFGVSKLGCEDEAKKISAEALTAHYNDIINNSMIELFYCGSAEPAFVGNTLRSALGGLTAGRVSSPPATNVILRPSEPTPKLRTENLEVTQGKLAIGFRLGAAMKTPDHPSLMVFNAIYGGSVTSKLFLNIRERLSLCYYASSMIDKHKGIMIVASGVDFSKFDEAQSEILAQLSYIKNGDVSDKELTSAKRYIITAIKSSMDRPAGLEDMYFDSAISASPYDPALLCDKIEAVTMDEVIRTASEIEPDTIYRLTSEECEV